MKIGILTFHDADNYGAVLQAYALQETIKNLGYNPVIINYKQPYIISNYKLVSLRTNNAMAFVKSIVSSVIKYHNRRLKKNKFKNFREKRLKLSEKTFYNPSEINGFDIYIVGSDQVWNNEITHGDKTFFLDFCKGKEKKISYAASVGKDILTDDDKKYLIENVTNFDFISIRESNISKVLSPYIDKPVYNVLDPTLLAEKNIWENFNSEFRLKNRNYLLIYRLAGNDEVFNVAEKISSKLNLEILYINDFSLIKRRGYHYIKNVGPEEFVKLVKNAQFVVTNSFHGTAFSILFNIDFVTIPHKTRGSRMKNLLEILKLEDRIITSSDQIGEDYKFNIDFKVANEILENEKNKSIKFLFESIKN